MPVPGVASVPCSPVPDVGEVGTAGGGVAMAAVTARGKRCAVVARGRGRFSGVWVPVTSRDKPPVDGPPRMHPPAPAGKTNRTRYTVPTPVDPQTGPFFGRCTFQILVFLHVFPREESTKMLRQFRTVLTGSAQRTIFFGQNHSVRRSEANHVSGGSKNNVCRNRRVRFLGIL